MTLNQALSKKRLATGEGGNLIGDSGGELC